MSVTITNLARSIDTIARRCPRGLSALAGDAPQPSHDELVAAATWTPAAEVSTPGGSSGGEHVTSAVAQVLALTEPIEAVGWERIVAATQEVRDGMYYFRAREIFKNLGYEYRQRERGFNGTGAVFLKQIPDGMKIGHGYQTFLSYDGVCEVFKLAQGGDVAFTVRRWGEKAEKRLKFMQFFFDNFSSEVCRRSGAEIKNPQFEHLLKMRRSDSMNDEQQ